MVTTIPNVLLCSTKYEVFELSAFLRILIKDQREIYYAWIYLLLTTYGWCLWL